MFRNMEYVYCVYKERSFSKAAEKLHIAQPSLSAMIRKMCIRDRLGSYDFSMSRIVEKAMNGELFRKKNADKEGADHE